MTRDRTGDVAPLHDVVIVGAGLAGLMAAELLKGLDVVLLERAGRAGGRVLTRSQEGVSYDLGAVFACDPSLLPFSLSPSASELRIESARIGLLVDGQIRWAGSVETCVDGLGDAEQTRALDAFFQVIHPGDRAAYVSERQRDAIARFATTHLVQGNGAMVAAFVERLGSALRLDAEVLDVREEAERVRITVRTGDVEEDLSARAVILATPAPAARRVLRTLGEPCRGFLDSLRHGEGVVVAVGVDDADAGLDDFAYLVTPDLPFGTLVLQHTAEPRLKILLVYYAGAKAGALEGLEDGDVVLATLAALRQVPIGMPPDARVRFTDVQRWPLVGPVISDESYGRWDPLVTRPSMRIFLAGDHVSVGAGSLFPYGMGAAIGSGRSAAESVRLFLKHEPSYAGFTADPLVEATVYDVTADAPLFRERIREGNVAFFGLILQAAPENEPLKSYLLDHARDGLWEYHLGFGVTAEDSALVIEGLLEAGADRAILEACVERLIARFYDESEGAFHTVRQGRAPYWHGPSIDATAHVGTLMQRLLPGRRAREIAACGRYLESTQSSDGSWKGKWFPSAQVTTFRAVRMLRSIEPRNDAALRRARDWLLAGQQDDGSWNGSVIDTASATLALRGLDEGTLQRVRAKEWLRSRQLETGWPGEPMLAYWFEIAGGVRRFFHCTDAGAITSAWATLALAGD